MAAAASVEAGVRLEVRPDIDHPRWLGPNLTPLFVTIENNSGRNLLVRPQLFHLIAAGVRHQAIPTDRLRRSDETPAQADVAIAMEGLPQDTLGNSARTTGFLYFDEFDISTPVTLTFELHAERDHAPLGIIRVPLVIGSNVP
jgi:hypothetical protein